MDGLYQFQEKRYWLGRYADQKDAVKVRKAAEGRSHEGFPWIGTIVPIRRPKLKKNKAPALKQILQAISRIIRERHSKGANTPLAEKETLYVHILFILKHGQVLKSRQ